MNEELAKAVVDRFVETWNAHDVAGFAACFREDSDFVNVLAEKAVGREAIAKMHEFPFKVVQAKATTYVQKLEFRELDSTLIALDFWWKVVGSQTPKGDPLPDRYGLIYFVIEVQDGEAHIVSGRNMDFTNSYGREAGGSQTGGR